jgi:Transglutaminase-like superfamily
MEHGAMVDDGISQARPSLPRALTLALRSQWLFLRVWFRVRRRPLPQVIEELGRVDRIRPSRTGPVRLGRIVARALSIGRYQVRCLYTSLVLFRLLHEEGVDADIVIGLPREPKDKDAHAWIEIDGRDVGPPPGRAHHVELARYGA